MPKKPKTIRGNYILFRYIIKNNNPLIEFKDRNGKFWYCELIDDEFQVITVTSKSLFEKSPDLENP